ncbi:MAG: protein translocase subunit SecF [Chloroflexota bacterium]
MFDVIGKRRWFFLFSAILTIPGLIFIVLTPLTNGAAGLQFSIDYTGGTNWEIRFERDGVTADQIKAVLAKEGVTDATVVATSGGFYEIRTRQVDLPPPPVASPAPSVAPRGSASPGTSPAPSASAGASSSPAASASAAPSSSIAPSPSASAAASPSGSPAPSIAPSPGPIDGGTELPTSGKLGTIATALQQELGPIASQRALSTVGPVISQELTQQAALLILLGSIGIVIWMTIRFQDVRFGATALVALVHDVIVVIGTFAILGTFFRVQIDALFVTAILTVIGFSVHDTIVVYDRIRENRARHVGEPFDRIVNHSILQTFGRSINTSLTVVITLTALLLFGGSATTYFVLALLIGIVSGTYSSIFNAAPLLVVWHDWDERRKARTAAASRPARRPAS